MEATPWLTCRAKLHRRRTGNRWQGAATSTSAAGCLLRRCLCTSYMGEAEFGWALYSSSSPDFRPQSLPAGFAHLAAYHHYHPADYSDDANRAREALSHRLVDFVTLGWDPKRRNQTQVRLPFPWPCPDNSLSMGARVCPAEVR